MTNDVNGGVVQPGLVDALAQTAYVVSAALTRVGAEHDLSLTQLRTLGILRGRRLRMAGLADYLGLERSTLSGLVDRAERRGLVARAPGTEDGRAVEVFLTPAGDALGERVAGELAEALGPWASSLAPDERDRLQALLERMLRRSVVEGVPADGAPAPLVVED